MEPELTFAQQYDQRIYQFLEFVDDTKSLTEIYAELKVINCDLLTAMEEVTKLLQKESICLTDVKHLIDLKIGYSNKIINKLIIKLQGQEIIKVLLGASLLQAYEKSKLFFNNDDISEWSSRENGYKVTLLQITEPKAIDFLFSYMNNLYNSLVGLYNDFNSDFSIITFNLIFKFEDVLEASLKETDLLKAKQVFVEAIATCELHCIKEKNFDFNDKGYINYLDKCRKAVESYNYKIKNTPTNIPQPTKEFKQIEETPKFKLASKKKTDFIKFLSAMYDARMFETEDGFLVTSKLSLFNELGFLFGEDFSKYSSLLSKSKDTEKATFLKPFDIIRRMAEDYYDKEYD